MIKVIIFDFDGVILDSLQIKTDAYADFYRPFGNNIVNKVINHHTLNGGMSRYDKISSSVELVFIRILLLALSTECFATA